MEENIASIGSQTILILKAHIQAIENGTIIPTKEDMEDLKTFFQNKNGLDDDILLYLFRGWYITECMGKENMDEECE